MPQLNFILTAQDAARARGFYERALGAATAWAAPDGTWSVMRLGPREFCIEGNGTGAIIDTGFAVEVEDFEQALTAVEQAGGRVYRPGDQCPRGDYRHRGQPIHDRRSRWLLDALIEVPRVGLNDNAVVTRRHHLKELVRARMARTGESYTTARLQLSRRAKAEVRGGPTVIVPVTDMRRATDFYSGGLGLAIRTTSTTWTVLGNEHETIALEPAGAAGVDVGIGIKVVDLAATLKAVAAAGGEIESHHAAGARVADPDGNVIRVVATGQATS